MNIERQARRSMFAAPLNGVPEGMRIFRVDRIEHAEVLDEPSAPPEQVELRNLDGGVFQPADEHLLTTLRLAPAYFWIADYYSTDKVEEGDGELLVELRVSDPALVRSMVLGSTGQVEVLAPDWLAESIRSDAATALAAYA